MKQKQSKRSRQDRTIVVDFHDEAPYGHLLGQGKAFIDVVVAFILSIGFQLMHTPACSGGWALTRHSPYARVRLGGLTIWRLPCTECKAVFTVLPHFVLRYRGLRAEVAKEALVATHGGLSLELCAMICHVSPLAIYRLVCALGRQSVVAVLTRCGLPLPVYCLADEKHSHCLSDKVCLPTIVRGRVIWHLGYSRDQSAHAFEKAYGALRQAALQHDPTYKVRGILTAGCESTRNSLRRLFPQARFGSCGLHAVLQLPGTLTAITSEVRQGLSYHFATLLFGSRQRQSLRVFAWGQQLRRFVGRVRCQAGEANGERVGQWFQDKKAGWYAVLEEPQMPGSSTDLDQAHNAIDRKLFMMKGFHHKDGSQQAFINGLALLYNVIPYQRRAKQAGRCGVEVEGGKLPTGDWLLNLHILTCGGFP